MYNTVCIPLGILDITLMFYDFGNILDSKLGVLLLA
jgi:hypothetical protein